MARKLLWVYTSDAQDLAVHAVITTVKVKNRAEDPELEVIGSYVDRGARDRIIVHGSWSLRRTFIDGLSKLGKASFPPIYHYPYFSTFK